MSSLFENILEILAAFGGGRGIPQEEIVRFLLPSVFWAVLLYTASNQWIKYRLERDRIISIAAMIGLIRELFMFSVNFIIMKGYIDFNSLHRIFPPVEHSLIMLSSIMVVYAFCKHFLSEKKMWNLYLYTGVGITVFLYLITAPAWVKFLSIHPDLKFGQFWGDMLFRVTASSFLFFALTTLIISRKRRKNTPLLLIIGVAMLFVDEMLMIINLYLKEQYKEIFNPIRHNLHIWSIPAFTGIYWNELRRKLTAQEEQIQNIFKLSPDILCLASPEGKIILANQAVKDVLGIDEKSIKGKKLSDFGFNVKDVMESLEKKSTVYSITPYRHNNGKIKWLYWKVLRDNESGNLYLNVTDITEKKLMEERLAASEEQYRLLFRYASDAILLFDESTSTVEDANYSAEILFGYSAEEFKNLTIMDLSAEPEKTKETIHKLRSENIRLLTVPKRLFRRKDGSHFAGEVNVGIYSIKGKTKCIVSVRDITERLKQQEELKRSEQQLRNLSLYLQNVREEERARIAREIHDELGQLLTAIKIDLNSCLNSSKIDDSILRSRLQKAMSLINDTISTVKRISMELRPSILDYLGITASIEWYVEEFEERTGIKCYLNFSPSTINIDSSLSITIFRVLQEALTNVARHSNATEVEINFKVTDDTLYMSIIDNGIGIRKDEIASPNSFGIIGIKERIRHHGGTVKIDTPEQGGTVIEIQAPLREEKKYESSNN